MRAFAETTAIAVLALAGACSDPSISISLDYHEPLASYVTSLGAAHAPVVTVRVIDADQALGGGWPRGPIDLADPDAVAGATCGELSMARVPPEVLAAATVSSAVLGATGGGELAGIPRLGRKRLLAEVRDADGLLLGLGCLPVDDVDADHALTIPVTAAAHVVRLHGEDPDAIELIAVAPWNDDIVLGRRPVEIDGYDRGGPRAIARAITRDDGSAAVRGLTAGAHAGPIDLLVRVEGNDRPLRVALWKPFPELGVLDLSTSSGVHSPIVPGAAAAWTEGRVWPANEINNARWTAVAAFDDGTGDRRWAGFRPSNPTVLERMDLEGMPAGAPLIWRGKLWLLAADGWHVVTELGIGGADGPASVAPALEAVRLEPCAAAGDDVALVRRVAGDPYEVYDVPRGVPHPSVLTDRIGGRRLVDVVCIGGTPPLRVVVVENSDGTLATINDRLERDVPLENVSHLTDLAVTENGSLTRYALGALLSETGPRARTFRFATFTVGQDVQGVMVPVPIVDLPLAGSASAVLAADLDGEVVDGEPVRDDVIATLPAYPGLRLQIVTDGLFAGEPLSATSPRLVIGARSTGRAVIGHADVDDDGADEVMVFADDGLIVYDDDQVR